MLALALVATAGGAWAATQIEPEVDFVDTVPDHDGLAAYRTLLSRLDGVRFVAVYMAHDPGSGTDSLRGEAFDALVAEQAALTEGLAAAFPDGTFTHTLSAHEAMRAGHYMFWKMATAGHPPATAYAMPSEPVTWEAVKGQVLADGTLDDVVARDGSSALLLAFLSTTDAAEARRLAGDVDVFIADWAADADRHPVTEGHASSGLLAAAHYVDGVNRDETLRWAPVAAGGVLVALLWVVRRPANAVIATASLATALVWTFGAMGLVGIRISFLTLFLAPVVIGIGIDYAVHVLHRYEEERDRGVAPADALGIAVRRTGRAVVLAAATTAAGLATLLLVPAPLFAQIGGVAALGILAGLLASLTVVPALRAVWPDRRRRTRRDRVGPALAAWARRMQRRPGIGPAVALACLVVAGAVAATATRVESGSVENELPQDDPMAEMQQRIEREYGAFQRAYLVVEGDLARADALAALHGATAATASLPLWRDAGSVTDLLVADARTDDGLADVAIASLLAPTPAATSDRDHLPQTDAEARGRLDALFEDPLWRTLAPFTVTRTLDFAVVAVQVEPWQDQAQLLALRNALQAQEAALQGAMGPDYTVSAAGSPMNRAAVVEGTPYHVAIATAGAASVVTLMLAFAWRRRGTEGIRMALLAGGVVLGATVVTLAAIPVLDGVYDALHARGAPANSASLTDMFLLAFAITVAVGVDDVVHLAHRTWEEEQKGRTRGQAVEAAFATAGRAVTGTSLTTFVAFALMAGVYFLQSKNLAILTAVGVASAYGLTLLVAPWGLRRTAGTSAERRVADPATGADARA